MADNAFASIEGSKAREPGRPTPRPRTSGRASQIFNSEELPVSLKSHVQRFLRVANQIAADSPRAAYLCRFNAFERAHNLDPHSRGRGVGQFKTVLYNYLEQNNEVTKRMRKGSSDAQELKYLYHKYDRIARNGATSSETSQQFFNAHMIFPTLLEVLKVLSGKDAEVPDEQTEENTGCFNILPLDLGSSQHEIMQLPEIKVSIAAIRYVHGLPLSKNHKEGTSFDLLDWLQDWFGFQKGNVANQREHLVLLFANLHVRQTPEPGSMPKLDDRAVTELLAKTFQNYNNWCRFLGRPSNIRLPSTKREEQQYQILYVALYFLIWGEASNLRLMPECLCYIFHHMAYDLSGVLFGSVSIKTGEKATPAYGGRPESFLEDVVTPLYKVIYEEALKNNGGTADHSRWRNYDDLNEYFWSTECFQIGWPMRCDHDFFCTTPKSQKVQNIKREHGTMIDGNRLHFKCKYSGYEDKESGILALKKHLADGNKVGYKDASVCPNEPTAVKILMTQHLQDVHKDTMVKKKAAKECPKSATRIDQDDEWNDKTVESLQAHEDEHQVKWLGKMNFIEKRSFMHLYRSFDRMWLFFISAFQVIIILAWHASESPLQLFNPAVFEDVISIFITWALFRVITVIIDIIFVWETRRTMSISQKGKFVVKLAVAIIWMITLPINYARSRQHSFCSSEQNLYQFGCKCMPEYIIAVMVYLASSSLEMALFFVPAVRNYIEMSDWTICSILSWWIEATTYVGRGMQENTIPLLKYSLFWILLLSCKLLFSFYFEIKPLVESTKQIMQISVSSYEWHELLPGVMNNVGAALAIWVPMTIVYFMDTQIWYSIFSAVFGGVYGIFCHLGEIRTMGMLRSRFMSFPKAFNAHFVPPSKKAEKRNIDLLQKKIFRMSEGERESYVKFAAVWNHIINSFRAEDLISNRERDLMIMPLSSDLGRGILRLPLFLLASKLSTALNMIQEFEGEYWQLDKMIRKDNCMYTAVEECLNLLRHVLDALVVGDREKRVVSATMSEIESNINNSTLLSNFKMSELPVLQDKLVHLVEILFKNEEAQYNTLVKLLQDIFEIVTTDMMIHGQKFTDLLKCSLEEDHCVPKKRKPPLFSSVDPKVLRFPLPHSVVPKEKVKRLFLLLTVKEAAMDIPTNLEARRRISFFATSLFMDMPTAPKVHEMLSFSVLTPYYAEEINFSEEELHSSPDGVSILSYMQKIHPDEWKNFLERMGYKTSDSLNYDHLPQKVNEEIRNWASFRGQTLNRTARGMMYYREAIKLQAFFDMAKDEDICETYEAIEKGNDRGKHPSHAKLDALADMKFTYVITCQMYGAQKASGDRHARDILELMIRYPSLRIAYIEEKEEIKKDKPPQKVYSSVLVKAFNNLDQEIYRIKLPGPPIIGEGKPENQNQGIIYTRGDALQTIDMNQDNYMEEAFKMRNLLQEFLRHDQGRYPTILGLGEHIFTGSVSSLAWFMSYQESSFVTIGQRFLASPLRVRFHYGHPDIFDRIFHLTTGGVSKATKTINLSEDVFAGFNTTLRSGCVTYHEYMKVGKGRDVGVIQISKFEAKVANGNSEQTLSRDIFRLGRGFDFFRMLSCYFTTVGFYLSSLMSVLGVYTFLYGQLYLVLSGMEEAFIRRTPTHSMKSLETALSSQSFIQLGLLTGLPMIMELALEKGFRTALSDFILMQLQLASVFFTFSLGTKSHYYGRTLLHGGAKYRTTGRKFVVFHASFTENYRLYSRSHFVKGFELLFLLVVYNIYSRSYQRSMAYVTVTCSIWFMTISWLFAPFLFNPSGFFWQKITEDWSDWNKWMTNHGGIGVQQDKSWESWWNDEQSHLRVSGLSSRILEILLSIRFFIYQYGLVYHLDIAQENKNIVVYVLSWFVIVAIFFLVKVVAAGRRHLSTSFHLMYRFFKALLFLAVFGVILVLFTICRLSIMDLIVCCLAFIPTGWGLLLIAQAISPKIENRPIWETVEALARAYDRGMGFLLFVPIAALAWMPVISAIQTRVLFNQAFTRQLQIQPILAAKGKRK